uniref:SLC26A5/6-like anion exchanger n=1 Tax=Ciona intestinalis TaxID=7719 RepID=F6VIT0_CIOIN
MESDNLRRIVVDRPFLNDHDIIDVTSHDSEIMDTMKRKVKSHCKSKVDNPGKAAKTFFLNLFPLLAWLPKYDVKGWLLADVISGVTVGVMQIPQGMSYALLAGQHPIYGLYNAFFPVLLYSILGTSRHVSMGSFAITSLMLGSAVSTLVPDPQFTNSTTNSSMEQVAWEAVYDERIMLGTAGGFLTGIFLLGLSLLNLGSIVIYLSDPMISGFTCGAAAHVFVSQLKGLFGVKVGSYSGPLNIVWVIRDVVIALTTLDDFGKTRTASTVVISCICIIFLLSVKEVNERFKKKLPLGIPVPGEIIVVILGTGISYAVNLEDRYNVKIIGEIPSGLPVPTPPPVDKFSTIIGHAIPIAIVGYSVAVSIAKIFANNFGYKIRPNQELVAFGASNLVSSFFFCFPAFPSMSRSCVQVDSGGKTQLVGIISAIMMLLVLLVIGPLFRTIPTACLAAIIAVAIKGMLRKARDFKPHWRTSKLDGTVWMVTCLGTIFLDVVYGLVVGVSFSLLCVVFRTQFVGSQVLSQYQNSEIYTKCSSHKHTNCTAPQIVRFNGPLYFANKDKLFCSLVGASGLNPAIEIPKRENEGKKKKCETNKALEVDEAGDQSCNNQENDNEIEMDKADEKPSCIIIDCSLMSFIDSVGLKFLKKVVADYRSLDVTIVFANLCSDVILTLERGEFYEKFMNDISFVSIADAVAWWRSWSSKQNEQLSTTRL